MFAFKTVRAPASSANLGPGFDTLGLALAIHLECRFEPADTLEIRLSGRDTHSIPTDESNMIWATAARVAREQGRALPPMRLEIHNDIPLGKGLGSSAAALTAGVAIADGALNLGWDEHRVLDEAARIEGHPDNVAAAVLGSITTAAIGADGVTRAIRLEIPDSFSVAVVCPDFELATSGMRGVLPDCYSREDAIFNLQRATLLVAALATGNKTVFPDALFDRLHQPFRMGNVPGMKEILDLRAPGLLGCAMSGAGPSMLVFFESGREDVVELVANEFRKKGREAEAMFPEIDRAGLQLS
ncbi:MAG: homoserine kinase [Acidobacteria bacterium]|nr:homoserine kinase [Acidobacteriota bacterium]